MRTPRAVAIALVVAAAVVAIVLLATGLGSPKRSPKLAAVHRAPADGVPPGSAAVVADVVRRTWMRASPGGRTLGRIGAQTQFGSPDVLLVQRINGGWLGVLSELAGNGRIGWVPRSAVSLRRDAYLLEASLSSKHLLVLAGGRVLVRYPIGIGASWAPTPTGQFAVTDTIVTGQPDGPYGCCIVALTATAAHAIPGWTGGNRIAIHATANPWSIGQPDSHGCLHVTPADASWLIHHVPDGTPVTIAG